MIVGIKGILARSTPLSAVVEAGGLFYELSIPVTTAEKLPKNGSEVFLHTHAVYREDSQTLYGFATAYDRDFFKLLVEKVSGIGPKIAINILSRMSVDTLKSAISAGDVSMLSKCPGIGKKTAERIVVELRDVLFKGGAMAGDASEALLSASQAAQPTAASDAVATLVALGYKLPDADKAVRKSLEKLGSQASTEELVKAALSR